MPDCSQKWLEPLLQRSVSLKKVMSEHVPRTMQAAVYRAPDEVRTETIPVPEIGSGEVLLRIDTCGVCGTDMK